MDQLETDRSPLADSEACQSLPRVTDLPCRLARRLSHGIDIRDTMTHGINVREVMTHIAQDARVR